MATFSTTQKGVVFGTVSEPKRKPANVPFAASLYEDSSDLASAKKLLNAVDIDWNGAVVGDGKTLHDSADLINWIKEGKDTTVEEIADSRIAELWDT